MRLGLFFSLAAAPACVYTHAETRDVTREVAVLEHWEPAAVPQVEATRVRLHRASGPPLDTRDVSLVPDGESLLLVPRDDARDVVRVPLASLVAVDVEQTTTEHTLRRESSSHAEPLIVGLVVGTLITALAVGVAVGRSFESWPWGEEESL